MTGNRANTAGDGDGKFYAIRIDCPGCGDKHVLPADWCPPGAERSPHHHGPQWGFNGNLALPTFTPSIAARSGHHANGKDECYCNMSQRIPGEEDHPEWCYVCHSYVTDGRIQFLDDCTHALRGQTVDLPEIAP